VISTLEEKPSFFVRENPILSSVRMLHKLQNNLVMSLKGLDAKTN
jgi:hypothetical protein